MNNQKCIHLSETFIPATIHEPSDYECHCEIHGENPYCEFCEDEDFDRNSEKAIEFSKQWLNRLP